MNNNKNLTDIIEKNRVYAEEFTRSPLMNLIQATTMDNARSRARMLECIQVFSNYFQKTVMLRAVLNDDNKHIKVAQDHLAEEFGHDISLMYDRNNQAPAWDPILDACSSWFSWKMITLDNSEKTLLVHLVLEESANIFFIKANEVMVKYNETDYFKIHAEVDEHHASMGLSLLKGLTDDEYANLSTIQHQGWDVLNAVCKRIAELTTKDN